MKKIQTIAETILNIFIYIFSHLIIKKKNLWVFGAWFGTRYSDNPRAFFEYVNDHHNEKQAVWISKDKKIVEIVRNKGYKAHYYKSPLGIWAQLRCNIAFVCQALQDDLHAPCIDSKTIVINLWHGLPLKKIMYDVFGDKVKNKNYRGKIMDYLTPYNNLRNDYLVATSKETQKTLSKAFRIPKNKALITGLPRNDIFFQKTQNERKAKPFRCIYMPTFRGGIGTECDLFSAFGFTPLEHDKILNENNIQLVLRMHPVNRPPKELAQELEKSHSLSIDLTEDIFDTIADYDCMITDYSGAYFDFLLSNKPIIFAPFDLDNYKKSERDLYYPYEDVTLHPYSKTWTELIDTLVQIKNHGVPKEYQIQYEKLKTLFHSPIPLETSPFSKSLYKKIDEI